MLFSIAFGILQRIIISIVKIKIKEIVYKFKEFVD